MVRDGIWARESGGWPWPASAGVDGLILSGEGRPDGLWYEVVVKGFICVTRILGRANHQ
jgi:hypothetical protein